MSTVTSRYYNREDLECHCGCGELHVDQLLLDKLDMLCDIFGYKLELSCAYRCPEHNAEVGGVPNSQHALGEAADVICPDNVSVNELASAAEQVGFDGIGLYYNSEFVHCDVRDEGDSPATYLWSDTD